jgi:hypothetical protein
MTTIAMTGAAAPARLGRVPLASPARLLRLELRRNPMPWLLPLLAALFWLTTYRPAVAAPPLWTVRAAALQSNTVLIFAPLLAGVAAWTGARDGRRGVTELASVTALPRWAARVAAWAAATCWAEAAYLAGVAVLYGVTAGQASWGRPLWWPVAVGVATLAASTALGFAAGVLLPSQFTAALTAIVVFLGLSGGAFAIQARLAYAQIWPLSRQGFLPDDAYGIFYRYFPDLAIAQVLFGTGLTVAALGALGLPAMAGRWLRCSAVAVTIAGLGLAGTAVGLAGTARLDAHGIVIPALHDTASDRPVRYIPVCSSITVPVCLHPAYRSYLPEVTAAVDPLLHELAGLPGAPARVTQVAVTGMQQTPSSGLVFSGPVLTGHPAVLRLPLSGIPLPGEGSTPASFTAQLRQNLQPVLDTFVGIPPASSQTSGGTAQAAICQALAQAAGLPTQPVQSAAQAIATSRFLALPAATRHAWLRAQLPALRAGHITLKEVP